MTNTEPGRGPDHTYEVKTHNCIVCGKPCESGELMFIIPDDYSGDEAKLAHRDCIVSKMTSWVNGNLTAAALPDYDEPRSISSIRIWVDKKGKTDDSLESE